MRERPGKLAVPMLGFATIGIFDRQLAMKGKTDEEPNSKNKEIKNQIPKPKKVAPDLELARASGTSEGPLV